MILRELCLAILIGLVKAQFGDWAAGQINTSICVWNQARAALVRNTIYIDGGSIWWTAGLENGTFGPVANRGNSQGMILSYSLSKPFDHDTNITGILLDGHLSKARGGEGNANSDAPTYYDGALLANDEEIFLYGGAVFQDRDLHSSPPGDEVLQYQAYTHRSDTPLWKPGFNTRRLPDGVTRYIAYGGAASAPSENKAWYFSGLATPNRGPFSWNAAISPDAQASAPSNTLITLDMSNSSSEKWTNLTLPSHIRARANPELVWVPVGEQGILVALGGVVYPEWASPIHVSPNQTLSEKESPIFMNTIDVYDITNGTWYQQPTTAGPGTRTRGCAVVAPAADRSSFNIYYYGGFDGVHSTSDFYDDVWVLSLPSFTWTKISDGRPSHARAGHKCFLPYPDQMMVVGGYTSLKGSTLTCLEDGPIVLFNLTSGTWMDKYDPASYGEYGVHEKVQAVIGGDMSGHATAMSPVPRGWATPALGDVFATPYDVNKIKPYWPYSLTPTRNETVPATTHKSTTVARWVAPTLGVVFGLVVLTGVFLAYGIWQCRKTVRQGFDTSSHKNKLGCLFCWFKRHTLPKSSLTSDNSVTKGSSAETLHNSTTTEPSATCYEMENTQMVSELGDTSPCAELPGTGLTTADAVRQSAEFAPLATNSGSAVYSLRYSNGKPVLTAARRSTDQTPAPLRPSLRRTRNLSLVSALSLGSSYESNGYSPNSLVSPLGLTFMIPEEEEDIADDAAAGAPSPLKKVVSNDDFGRTAS